MLLPIPPSFLEVVLNRKRVKLIKGYPWFAARSSNRSPLIMTVAPTPKTSSSIVLGLTQNLRVTGSTRYLRRISRVGVVSNANRAGRTHRHRVRYGRCQVVIV